MLTAAELPRFGLDGESFLRPDFAGRGLANIAPTVLQLLAPNADPSLALPALDSTVLPERLTQDVKSVVLVVADGLGHLQLEREIVAGNAPNIGELIARANRSDPCVSYAPITSVFPTTTVAALGSVNSGVAPSHHGLLAYTLLLPEFDMVAEMIRWGPLNRRVSFAEPEFGKSPEAFFGAETIYSRLHAAGVERAFAVNPSHFSGTALTRMLHQSATYAGYVSTSSVPPIVSRIVHDSTEPTYVYAYWPTVDTIAHVVGPLTPEHASEVAGFDFQFGRLLTVLGDRHDTLVLLTADHGHIDTRPEDAVNFADHPELLPMLRAMPAGERRVVYLYPRDGACSQVVAYTRERLNDAAATMLRDEAVAGGLFGPDELDERASGRIGEVLLFPRGALQLVTPIDGPDGAPVKTPTFRGLHGGLTADEAVVPLLAVRV
jgi:predicted AlkP superfamily pyrophosphatase or phosphodiesterase